MNSLIQPRPQRWLSFLTALCLSVAGASPAWSDDTEVFLGNPELLNQENILPNVLFILDNSGSMASDDGEGNRFGSRMAAMQWAFRQVMNESEGFRGGIMQFSSPGGAITKAVANVESSLADPVIGTRYVSDARDDAWQYLSAYNGDEPGYEPDNLEYSTGPGIVVSEPTYGTVDPDPFLVIGNKDRDGQPLHHIIALRFENVRIPQGASLDSASLTLMPDNPDGNSNHSGNLVIDITGILKSTTEPYDNGGFTTTCSITHDGGCNGTLVAETSPIPWTVTDIWTTGSRVQSAGIEEVVQEIINQEDWCGGNDLTLLLRFSGDAYRPVVAADAGVPADAPRLNFQYTPDNTDGCQRETSGINITDDDDDARQKPTQNPDTNDDSVVLDDGDYTYTGYYFRDVPLGKDDHILGAYLQFHAAADSTAVASFDIWADKSALTPESITRSHPLDTRTPVTSSVRWDLSSADEWIADDTLVQTADITSILEEIQATDYWESGGEILFVMEALTSAEGRRIYMANHSTQLPPRLVIEREGTAGTEIYTVATGLADYVDTLVPETFTPIVGALYESYRYFASMSVDIGKKRFNYQNAQTYGRVSVQDSWTTELTVTDGNSCTDGGGNAGIWQDGVCTPSGCDPSSLDSIACANRILPVDATYTSPDVDQLCISNHVVLLTDGRANANAFSDDYNEDNIAGLSGMSAYLLGGASQISENADYVGAGECTTRLYRNAEDTVGTQLQQGERCGLEMARYMREDASHPTTTHTIGFALSASAQAREYLEGIAYQSGGEHYIADTAAELVAAFQSILSTIRQQTATFVPAGVTINQYNRLLHRDELYYALFYPYEEAAWDGNLKRYRAFGNTNGSIRICSYEPGLNDDNEGTCAHVAVYTDADENGADGNAVEGKFKDEALSWWNSVADGDVVADGGAAANLPTYSTRTILTDLGVADNDSDGFASFDAVNDSITLTAMGFAADGSDASLEEAILWARGATNCQGNSCDDRKFIADPLHSQPLLVNYSSDRTADFPNQAWQRFEDVVYFGSNEGFLHAIDAQSGEEVFSFIPEEVMSVLGHRYRNSTVTSTTRQYGVDASPSALISDYICTNSNACLTNPSLGDHDDDEALLFFGLRRGGAVLYALDVTDPEAPKLQYRITDESTGYEELGQTWSKPQVGKIRVNGGTLDVLVFGAGYHTGQDHVSGDPYTRRSDNSGNALYITDARTGALIWKASGSAASTTGEISVMLDEAGDTVTTLTTPQVVNVAAMQYGVPSEPTLIDINADGYFDQIVVADIGGQVLRFFINNTEADAFENGAITSQIGEPLNASAPGVMARLAAGPVEDVDAVDEEISVDADDDGELSDGESLNLSEDNLHARRFYNKPAVTFYDYDIPDSLGEGGSNQVEYARQFSVSIGSGFRAHPNDMVTHDRLYHVRSTVLTNNPAVAITTLSESDLARRASSAANTANVTADADGWLLTLDGVAVTDGTGTAAPGEKILTDAVVFNSVVIFSTYRPLEYIAGGACQPSGVATTYAVDLRSGKVNTLKIHSSATIPPSPNILLLEDPDGIVRPYCLVGTENCFDEDDINSPMHPDNAPNFNQAKKRYWFRKLRD